MLKKNYLINKKYELCNRMIMDSSDSSDDEKNSGEGKTSKLKIADVVIGFLFCSIAKKF